jgi:hypothetical protein
MCSTQPEIVAFNLIVFIIVANNKGSFNVRRRRGVLVSTAGEDDTNSPRRQFMNVGTCFKHRWM